jgi:ribosome-associated protein
MGALLRETRAAGLEDILAVCNLLEEHKAGDVTALDLRDLHSWTDFFVIATVSSGTHLNGLLRHIAEFAAGEGLTVIHRAQREESGGWNLVDMGTAVIHLMTSPSREFYELEELWSSAGRIYPA